MIVVNGQWWLPAERGRAARGDLNFGHRGYLRLELDSDLVPFTGHNTVVWGATDDDRPVTLPGCWAYTSGRPTQSVHVHAALIGAHVSSAGDAVFMQEEVSLSNLTDWATRVPDSPTLPMDLTNPVDPKERLTLHRAGEGVVHLTIESKEPRIWSGVGTTTQAFQDLLTMAGAADCRIESAVLTTTDGAPVNVWTKPDPVIDNRWHPEFALGTVPDGFISDWLTLRAKLAMSGSVLFSLDYGGPSYYQNKLFNAAATAEGIHEILCPDATAIPAAEHAALKKHIRTMDPGPAQKWALDTLRRNQPGFTTRMRQLAAIPDADAVAHVVHDEDTWVSWMGKARNAIGHSSWDDMNKIPREVRPALIHVTKTLLHLVLFEKLGLTADVQRSAARGSYTWHRASYDEHFA